jgi:hypothetical protein
MKYYLIQVRKAIIKRIKTSSTDENVYKGEPLYTFGGNVN